MSSPEKSKLPVGIGSLIAGKYRVDRVLGEGGMGVVAQALHVGLNQVVAIKFMTDATDENAERFLREARAAAQIRSEHVVRVTDVGAENSVPYMVMELLSGRDLGELVASEGPLALPLAVDIMLQACEALTEAHARGIVHRDIKPSNLFVTARPDGSPFIKVLDFGISKVADAGPGIRHDLTDSRTVFGSPTYMSPEQMKAAKQADHRSDIWSLGALLFELLAGEPPFSAPSLLELAAAILTEEPSSLQAKRPDLPASLVSIVLRCLEKDPANRPQSVDALAKALAPFTTVTVRLESVRPSSVEPQALGLHRGATAPLALDASQSRTATSKRLWVVGGAVVGLTSLAVLVFAARGATSDPPIGLTPSVSLASVSASGSTPPEASAWVVPDVEPVGSSRPASAESAVPPEPAKPTVNPPPNTTRVSAPKTRPPSSTAASGGREGGSGTEVGTPDPKQPTKPEPRFDEDPLANPD